MLSDSRKNITPGRPCRTRQLARTAPANGQQTDAHRQNQRM